MQDVWYKPSRTVLNSPGTLLFLVVAVNAVMAFAMPSLNDHQALRNHQRVMVVFCLVPTLLTVYLFFKATKPGIRIGAILAVGVLSSIPAAFWLLFGFAIV